MTAARRFALAWGQAVHEASYVLMTRAEREAFFLDLTERLAAALTADPFDAYGGYQVGTDLAEADAIAPEALGRTVTLLSTRLLADLELHGLISRDRLTALVEALCMGYTAALQDRTLDKQDSLRRADIAARTEAEQALRRSEERLRHAALHDALTGLPNRALVTHWLAALRTAPDPPERFGVCVIGIDRFTAVNNSLGYAVGDRLLVAVAERLSLFCDEAAHCDSGLAQSRGAEGSDSGLAQSRGAEGSDSGLAQSRGAEGSDSGLAQSRGAEGDAFPRRFAPRSRRRRASSLAHLGGDQFALLIRDTEGPEDAVKPADRALAALRAPFHIDGHELPMTASAGVVERAVDAADPVDALRAAAMSLYWAKAEGRDRFELFDEIRSAREVARYKLSAEMPGALARGEFSLAYQPLMSLADGSVAGVEGLARWHHPELGELPPARFIHLAEDSGFIVPLGIHLLERACRQAVRWRTARPEPPVVSVNLAARQLCHPSLAADVATVLDRTGLPAELLQLEITESDVMTAEADAVANLHALAGLGVRIALDDFGTGYCSLAYLRRLPVHGIKLAGAFSASLGRPGLAGRTDEAVLTTLVHLGHTLDLTVTAEGIETAAQLERLRAIGCDLGQGWLLGRPTTADRVFDHR
ncbi:putative bifunctional diguanylate cyclase/phosphodiesterase [Micromonospora sp. CPCC 206061]|uniref:putative bifunctional diguanylate cyclase/phosphodiesterase n=1 Tax=Micromonospora sp. CPCC 206061 TaxID=3122410 RepID=UPI002FF0E12F